MVAAVTVVQAACCDGGGGNGGCGRVGGNHSGGVSCTKGGLTAWCYGWLVWLPTHAS